MFEWLEKKEKEQLVDYIISSYNCVDYDRLISFYGSYEQTCLAFASNQGKEFGLHEEFTPGDHTVYIKFAALLRRYFGVENIHDIFRLPEERRKEMALFCFRMTSTSRRQTEKYFRVEW